MHSYNEAKTNNLYLLERYNTNPSGLQVLVVNVLRPESLLISPKVIGVARMEKLGGGMSCRPTLSPTYIPPYMHVSADPPLSSLPPPGNGQDCETEAASAG